MGMCMAVTLKSANTVLTDGVQISMYDSYVFYFCSDSKIQKPERQSWPSTHARKNAEANKTRRVKKKNLNSIPRTLRLNPDWRFCCLPLLVLS